MRIIFSANDAGAGNSVFPLVKGLKRNHKLLIVAAGPAKRIFLSENIVFKDGDQLDGNRLTRLVTDFRPNLFVGGSSLGMTVDKKILKATKVLKIPSIYILDFWSNYWQRFSGVEKDFSFLPDLICVMDSVAKKQMIDEGFDARIIKITGNPYFDVIKKRRETKISNNRIVFISQPLSVQNRVNNVHRYKFDEITTFKKLLSILRNITYDYELVVRLHPSEKAGKFESEARRSKVDIAIDHSDLLRCISDSKLVIGINSAALLVANLMGKQVISYFPGAERDRLIVRKCLGIKAIAQNSYRLKMLLEKYFSGKLKITTTRPNLSQNASAKIIDIITHYEKG